VMADVTYCTFSSKMELYQKCLESHVPIGKKYRMNVDSMELNLFLTILHLLSGETIHNNVVYVMDDDLNLMPMDSSGEIYVAGYNLAKGYVGNKEPESFKDNPHTKSYG